MTKPILDPCCGSKMFYFDKNNPSVDFRDNREVSTTLCDGRPLIIEPDTIGDVLDIASPDESYYLVVFDPPHMTGGDAGWQIQKYGKLPDDWREWMATAFAECWRVLKPNGTLIFKWYEYKVRLTEILECAPAEPVLGNRRTSNSKTHWLCFFKGGDTE